MISKKLFEPTYVYPRVKRDGFSIGTRGELKSYEEDVFGNIEYRVQFSTDYFSYEIMYKEEELSLTPLTKEEIEALSILPRVAWRISKMSDEQKTELFGCADNLEICKKFSFELISELLDENAKQAEVER